MMTLEEAIKSLGDSYDNAIRVLIESGIKGVGPGKSGSPCLVCIVARYLQAKTGKAVEVGYSTAYLDGNDELGAALPWPVQDVIRMFDKGRLPELTE